MPRSKGTFTQHWDIQGTKDKPVRLQLAGEVIIYLFSFDKGLIQLMPDEWVLEQFIDNKCILVCVMKNLTLL